MGSVNPTAFAKLTDANYLAWRAAVDIVLAAYDMEDLLEEEGEKVDAKKQKRGIAIIAQMLPMEKLSTIKGIKTAKVMCLFQRHLI